MLHSLKFQVAQLSQRDRTAGWVNYGQKWKTGMGDNRGGDTGVDSLTNVYRSLLMDWRCVLCLKEYCSLLILQLIVS